MIVKGFKCNSCHDIIFSRTLKDIRYCQCLALNVNNGPFQPKSLTPLSQQAIVIIDINTTINELYNDWNCRIDNFGIHRSSPRPHHQRFSKQRKAALTVPEYI